MTNAQRILDYLWTIAPDGATNGQIARRGRSNRIRACTFSRSRVECVPHGMAPRGFSPLRRSPKLNSCRTPCGSDLRLRLRPSRRWRDAFWNDIMPLSNHPGSRLLQRAFTPKRH
jgi:hypothetical protein